MFASRVRRALAELEREPRRPVLRCAGVVDREDREDDDPEPTRPTSGPAEHCKIETLLEKLLSLLPRGRKLRVLDLCNGESTLLEAEEVSSNSPPAL